MGRFTKYFRQQYSKIGYTREQLFHVRRSFHFDKNTETIATYVNHLRQVTTPLGYQEPQVLEVFKNTLSTKLYWVLFPIMDLRQVVETAKMILTKEKIDRQLAGQTSTTPFMNIRDGFNRRVTFDTADSMEQKIDKLMVMMGKLVTADRGQNKPFKLRVYQTNRGRGQVRCNFDQRRYQGRFRSNTEYRGNSRYNQDYRGSNRGSYRYNTGGNQSFGRNNNRSGNYRNQNYDRNRSRPFERQNRHRRDNRKASNIRIRSGSKASRNRDRIRCFKCGEYNHFARECLTKQANREIEQIQQMFNMDKDQKILQTPLMDTDEEEQTITPVGARYNLDL